MHKVAERSASLLVVCLLCASVAEGRQPVPAADRVFRISGSVDATTPGTSGAYEAVAFGIYETEHGGAPLWQEVQTVAIDAQGHYTVLLGATSADGLPVDLFASGPRWLATEVLGTGGAATPRVLLTSVPYAVRAATAGDASTLAGRPVSDFQLTRAARNSVTGAAGDAASLANRDDGPLVNSGTANYIGKFQNTVDLVNSALYDSAGRIGIGTTTPLDSLHVRFTDAAGSFTGLAVQNMSGAATAYSGMLFYDHTGALGQFQGFNNSTKEYRINNVAAGGAINFMLAGTSRFRVAPGGNVGMGTTSPAAALHVTGTIRSDVQYNLGANRMLANTGTENLFVGALTGAVNTGTQNVFVGNQAGAANTTGSSNTFVGRNAGAVNLAAANSTFVGANAGVNSVGASNTFVGQTAGDANTMGSLNTLLGAGSDVGVGNLTNASAIGAFASVTQSNALVLGSITGINGAAADTAVGIGTTAPLDRLQVTGDIRVGAGTTGCVKDADATVIAGTCASDLRFKTDVRPFDTMLEKVAGLRPVTFAWRWAEFPERGFGMRASYGLIAQEVEQVLPDLVVTDAQGYRAVNYSKLPLLAIQAVKELKAENDTLRTENAALAARLDALEHAVRALTRAPTAP